MRRHKHTTRSTETTMSTGAGTVRMKTSLTMWQWTALSLLAIVMASRLVIPVSMRLWGLDATRYLPGDPLQTALIIASLICLIPPVGDAVHRAWHGTGRRMPARWYWSVASILTLAAAWIGTRVHMLFALYGDGSYYQTEIIRMLADPARAPGFIKPTAFLSGHLVAFVTTILQPADARIPYTAVGVLSLILLVAGAFTLLRGTRLREALLVAVPLAASAGILTLFGYVELYAFPFTLAVLHLIALWRAIRENRSLVPAALLLAIAITAGATTAVFIPGLLCAVLMRFQREARARIAWLAIGGMAALTVLAIIAYGGDVWNPYVLPLRAADMIGPHGMNEGRFTYTLFSGAHLGDLVNLLLLVSAPSLAVLLGITAAGIPALRRSGVSDPLLLIAIVEVAAALLASFSAYAYFGLARDWDALAIPLLALPFAASALLGHSDAHGRIHTGFIAASLASGILWVHFNTTAAAALRFSDILARDTARIAPQRTYTGLESLRKYQAYAGNAADEEATIRRMSALGWNRDETWRRLLVRAMEDENSAARMDRFSFLLHEIETELRSPHPSMEYRHIPARRLRELLATVLIASRYRGDAAMAREQLGAMTPIAGAWKERPFVEAVLLDGGPMAAKADIAAASVDSSCTSAVLLSIAADHLVAAGRHVESARLYERALAVEPGAWPAVYVRLARLYDAALRDRPSALRVLERCADECLLYPGRPGILDAIRTYREQGVSAAPASKSQPG